MNEKLIDIALDEYGITELPGSKHNPEVLKYFHETGREWVKDDETSWCDAFVDWCAMMAGSAPTPGLNARAWLEAGEKVEHPKRGDVVILWREKPDSWKGHVGLFIKENEKMVWLLGGNQNNQVKISAYRKNRVLGYRRLMKIERRTLGKHQSF